VHLQLAAIVALLAPAALRADAAPLRPIPWLEPSALAKPFLQLAFEAPETVRRGALEVSIRTFYSNTILLGWGPSLMVKVQVETAQPTAVVRYGVAEGTELQLLVPGAIDYAGWLARPIKVIEGLVSRVNPLRLGPPPREGRIQIQRYKDGTGVDWTGEDAAVGDLAFGVKTFLRPQAGYRPALSLRVALGLPTGRFPDGTGQVALAAGTTAGWTRGATALWVEADGALPGRTFSALDLPVRPHGALQLGVARRLGSSVSVHAQASVHSPALAPTGIPSVDGPTFYLLGGLTVEPVRAMTIGLALVENVFTTTHGADFTGVLELTWRR
jgi:hypothetical protein